MNRVARLAGLTVLAGLLGASAAAAQVSQTLRVSGIVAALDQRQRVLQLRVEKPAMPPGAQATQQTALFVISDRTQILERERPAELASLEVGERITIDYTVENGQHLAQLIRVEEPAATEGQP